MVPRALGFFDVPLIALRVLARFVVLLVLACVALRCMVDCCRIGDTESSTKPAEHRSTKRSEEASVQQGSKGRARGT